MYSKVVGHSRAVLQTLKKGFIVYELYEDGVLVSVGRGEKPLQKLSYHKYWSKPHKVELVVLCVVGDEEEAVRIQHERIAARQQQGHVLRVVPAPNPEPQRERDKAHRVLVRRMIEQGARMCEIDK